MDNKKILGIVGSVIAVVIGIGVIKFSTSDRKGPVITYSDEELTYTEGEPNDVLLKDVTAVDNKDGDVSDTLMVANKIVIGNGEYMEVVYAAKDSKNNITTTKNNKRRVKYISTGANPSQNTEANDENQSSEQTDASNEASTNESTSENQTTNTTVEDSGPTGEIDKAAADATGIPVIKLKTAETTIKAGQSFNEISFVRETYDNSGDVSRRIRITGDYNISVPGDYHINYLVSDTEGNVSAPAPFTLHVIPADTPATYNTANNTGNNTGNNTIVPENGNVNNAQPEQNVQQGITAEQTAQ